MRPVSPAVLFGVSIWRLMIVFFAFYGLSLYVDGEAINMVFFTQQGNLLTGVVYSILLVYPLFTGGKRHEPYSGWARGMVVVTMLLVGGVYLTLMEGSLEETRDLFAHFLTPLVVLLDWLFVGRNQMNCRFWHPLTWLIVPLGYLAFYISYDPTFREKYGQSIYEFLDPEDSEFSTTVLGLLGVTLIAAYILFFIGKIKGAISQANRPHLYAPPQWPGQPYPYQYQQSYSPYQPQYPQRGYSPAGPQAMPGFNAGPPQPQHPPGSWPPPVPGQLPYQPPPQW